MKFLAIVSAAPILSFAQSIDYSKNHTLDVKGLQISQTPTQKLINYEIIPNITDILIINGTAGGDYIFEHTTDNAFPPTIARGDNIITYDGGDVQQVEGLNEILLNNWIGTTRVNGERVDSGDFVVNPGLRNEGKWNKTYAQNVMQPSFEVTAKATSFDDSDQPGIVKDGLLSSSSGIVSQSVTVAPGAINLSSLGNSQKSFLVDRDYNRIVDYQRRAQNSNTVADGDYVGVGRTRTNNLRVKYDEGPLKVDTNDILNINAQLTAAEIPLLQAIAETETGAVVKALALMWADALLNQDLLV